MDTNNVNSVLISALSLVLCSFFCVFRINGFQFSFFFLFSTSQIHSNATCVSFSYIHFPQLPLYATIVVNHVSRHLDHLRPKKSAYVLVIFKLQWLLPGQELQRHHFESVYIRPLSRNAGGLKFRCHVPLHTFKLPGSHWERRKFLSYLTDFS